MCRFGARVYWTESVALHINVKRVIHTTDTFSLSTHNHKSMDYNQKYFVYNLRKTLMYNNIKVFMFLLCMYALPILTIIFKKS